MGPVAFRKHITYPRSLKAGVVGPRPLCLPNLRERLDRYRADRCDPGQEPPSKPGER
jgi:hypothetical protein